MAKGRNRVVLMLVERLLDDITKLQNELIRESTPSGKARKARTPRGANGEVATTEPDNG